MKTKQPELNKITALYERLSRDDELSDDRNSRHSKDRPKRKAAPVRSGKTSAGLHFERIVTFFQIPLTGPDYCDSIDYRNSLWEEFL